MGWIGVARRPGRDIEDGLTHFRKKWRVVDEG